MLKWQGHILDLFTCSLGDENANKSIIKDFLNYLYEILMFIALHAVINFLEIILASWNLVLLSVVMVPMIKFDV